ncbi:malectin [Trichonephila clavipes]|nr:malectin [Trichonephila clavipes]
MKVFVVTLNGVHTIVSDLDIFTKLEKRWRMPLMKKKEEATQEKKTSPIRYPSGPRIPNPYETEDSSTMLPIFIAIGSFLPPLFCLCRL